MAGSLALTTITNVADGNGLTLQTISNNGMAFVVNTSTTALTISNSGVVSIPIAGLTIGSGTGLLKTTSGVISTASAGTDYAPITSGTSILKGNGSGGFSAAVSSTDYAPATSGTSLLRGNNAGGFASVVSGTDIKTVNGTTLLGSGDVVIAIPTIPAAAKIYSALTQGAF